jgi:hypothetical protein
VLYLVIWVAEAIKQVMPETVQWRFYEVKFCMSDLTEKETNEKNVQDLQVYLMRLCVIMLWQKITLTFMLKSHF